MKAGLTLEQLGQELVCQSEVKRDYLVSSDKMTMETYGGLPVLRVLDSAGEDCMEPLELNSTAHRQMSGYLRIPANYYERMLKEYPELLAHNVNSWLSRTQEVKLLRTLDGTARAILSNRYWCVDNLQLLQAAVPVIGNMLGMSSSEALFGILKAYAAGDAEAMLEGADRMQTEGASFDQALRDIAGILHRAALMQRVSTAVAQDDPDYAALASLAASLAPEEIQLCYQIALHGRNDLGLAPDEYAGFTMTLLRMLAFKPAGFKAPHVPSRGEEPKRRNEALKTASSHRDKPEASRPEPPAPPPVLADETPPWGEPAAG